MFRSKLSLNWLVLLAVFSFFGCNYKEKAREVDLSDTVELTEPGFSAGKVINICVGSMVTPKEGFAYYKALLDYIGGNLKMKMNFIERESYAEVNALLEEGKIDAAFVCGGPYIEGHDKFGLELLVAPEIKGKTVYYSYIIVRADSNINNFEELKGKAFVFTDPLSNSGKLYPASLLKQMQHTPDTFFSDYVYSYAHDSSIRAVSEGFADAAAVDSLIWDYMVKAGSPFTKNIRIIKVSPPFGIPPIVVRPGLEKGLKERIKQVLLDMHQTKSGREILDEMLIERFVLVSDSNYNSIRQTKLYLEK